MDTERIVEGVIASIDTLGPVPPSARQLASRLHVAPATLYSSVPSLFDAYGQARSVLAEQFVGPLLSVLNGGGRGDELADVLRVSPNRSTFVTDPSWALPDTEALAQARAGTDITLEMMIDGFALVGSLFSVDSLPAHAPSSAEIEEVLQNYRAAITTRPHVTATADALAQVTRTATGSVKEQNLDPVSEDIRIKSIELIVQNTKWSFRALREQTGLAVSRLHRYGTRIDHMAAAYIALGAATAKWAETNVAQDKNLGCRLALLFRTGAPAVMAELEHLRRCDPDGRADEFYQSQIDGIAGPQAVALATAQLGRGVDPAEVAGIGGVVGTTTPVELAA